MRSEMCARDTADGVYLCIIAEDSMGILSRVSDAPLPLPYMVTHGNLYPPCLASSSFSSFHPPLLILTWPHLHSPCVSPSSLLFEPFCRRSVRRHRRISFLHTQHNNNNSNSSNNPAFTLTVDTKRHSSAAVIQSDPVPRRRPRRPDVCQSSADARVC